MITPALQSPKGGGEEIRGVGGVSNLDKDEKRKKNI
jgi:hypothetical protein